MTQIPDNAPGPYYISVTRDGTTTDARLVSGPYDQHADALALVDKARRVCETMDVKAVWYAFGTVRMRPDYNVPGILQKQGYSLDIEKAQHRGENKRHNV